MKKQLVLGALAVLCAVGMFAGSAQAYDRGYYPLRSQVVNNGNRCNWNAPVRYNNARWNNNDRRIANNWQNRGWGRDDRGRGPDRFDRRWW